MLPFRIEQVVVSHYLREIYTPMSSTNIPCETLVTLHKTGLLMTRRLTVEGVLDALYQAMSRLLDAANMYIILYHAEKQETTFALRVEEGKMEKPFIIQPLQKGGLTHYVLSAKQPLLLEEHIEEHLTHLGIHGRQIHPRQPTVSWLGVPILDDEQILGMMAVQSYTTPGLFTEADRDVLMMLAEQAAIALTNARQFEQIQRENTEWKAMQKETQNLHEELEDRVRALNEELAFAYEEIQRLNKQHQKKERQHS